MSASFLFFLDIRCNDNMKPGARSTEQPATITRLVGVVDREKTHCWETRSMVVVEVHGAGGEEEDEKAMVVHVVIQVSDDEKERKKEK